MKRFVAFGFVAVVLASATGCSSGAEGALKEMIADMNALSDAVEKKESPDKIKAAAQKMKASAEKLEKIKVTKSEDDRLKTKYEKDVNSAVERMMKAMMSNPEAAPAVAEAMQAMKK